MEETKDRFWEENLVLLDDVTIGKKIHSGPERGTWRGCWVPILQDFLNLISQGKPAAITLKLPCFEDAGPETPEI